MLQEIADASASTEYVICLWVHSRGGVDEPEQKALQAVGTTYKESRDHRFMYRHAYQGLDGHL